MRAHSRARVEQPWIVGGVGAGLGALTRLPVGAIRTAIVLMVVGTRWWLGLGIYAVAALVVPHGGRRLPHWSNVVGLLRVGSVGLITFLSRYLSFDQSGIFGQGPEAWVPMGGLLLIGWVAVLHAGGHEPSEEDRAVALAVLPALTLAAVVMIVMWLAPGVRAAVVLDCGLAAVGGILVVTRPRVRGRGIAYVPVGALALLAIVCAFSGAGLAGGIGASHIAPREPSARASYGRAIGTVTFDASHWRGVAGDTERVNLAVGIGTIRIIVPQDISTTVDARVGHGQLVGEIPATESFFVHRRFLAAPPPYAAWLPRRSGRLQIDAAVGDGCLIVLIADASFSSPNC